MKYRRYPCERLQLCRGTPFPTERLAGGGAAATAEPPPSFSTGDLRITVSARLAKRQNAVDVEQQLQTSFSVAFATGCAPGTAVRQWAARCAKPDQYTFTAATCFTNWRRWILLRTARLATNSSLCIYY